MQSTEPLPQRHSTQQPGRSLHPQGNAEHFISHQEHPKQVITGHLPTHYSLLSPSSSLQLLHNSDRTLTLFKPSINTQLTKKSISQIIAVVNINGNSICMLLGKLFTYSGLGGCWEAIEGQPEIKFPPGLAQLG